MKIFNKYFNQRIYSLLFKFSSIIFSFILAKLFVEFQGISEYGVYNLVLGYTLFFSNLFSLGQGTLLLKMTSIENNRIILSEYIYGIWSLIFLSSLFVLALGAISSHMFNDTNLFVGSIIVAINLYNVVNVEYIRAKHGGNYYVFFKDIIRIIILSILLFIFDTSAIIMVLVSTIIISLVLFFAIFRELDMAYSRKIDLYQLRKNFRDGIPLSFANSTQILKGWIDTFLLGFIANNEIVGIYNMFLKFGKVISMPLVSLNADIGKKVSLLINNKSDFRTLNSDINITIYLSILLYIVLVLIMMPLFDYYQINNSLSNIMTFLLVCSSFLVNAIYGPIGLIMQLSEERVLYFKVMLFIVIFGLLFNFILYNSIGLVGIGVGFIVTNVMWNYIMKQILKKKLII